MILNFEYDISCGAGHAPQLIHMPDNMLHLIYLDDSGAVQGKKAEPYLGLYDNLSFTEDGRLSPDESVSLPSLKKVAHYGAYGFWSAEGDHKFVIYMLPTDISDALIDGQTQFSAGNECSSMSCSLLNIRGRLINRYRSILTPGTKLELYVALGDSDEAAMGIYYIDRASVSYPEEKVQVSARDAIGKLLKEQTFDENTFFEELTLQDNIKAVLDLAGVENYFVGDATSSDPLEFEPDVTILEGLKYAIALLSNWSIAETAEGVVGIASADDPRFDQPAKYTFERDHQCWNYSVEFDDSNGANRVCVTSESEEEGGNAERVYKNVGYNPWWAQPAHRTLYVKTVNGASHAQVEAYAEQLATILRQSGRMETFAGVFTPQLTLGDEVHVTDHNGAKETVGSITDVTHSFGKGGFITSFTVDSGGRRGRAKLKDLINSATDAPVAFTGVKTSGDTSVEFMNSSVAEVENDTEITSSIVTVASNLVLAFVVHRYPLTSTPDGWTLLHTSTGITESYAYTQQLSVFYRFPTEATVSGTWEQTAAQRMYVNMIALANAATPYVVHSDVTVSASSVSILRPSSDEKVVWAFHRLLWATGSSGAKWQATNVDDEYLVQLNVTQPRLLNIFDGARRKRITVSETANMSNKTEYLAIGIPVAE